METTNKQPDYLGDIIVFILLGLLVIAGVLSYRAIEWDVLDKLEKTPLVLPTETPAPLATESATPTL